MRFYVEYLTMIEASLEAQTIRNLLAMQETWPGSSPGEELTPYSSILAWEIPWTEKPALHGIKKSQI